MKAKDEAAARPDLTTDVLRSQGDGEVSFCGAIEMSGFLVLKTSIIRNGMAEYLTPMGPTKLHVNPIFEIGPCEPRFRWGPMMMISLTRDK